MSSTHPWWKEATFFQIWPASYKDGNGDGMGDIPGAITTLDYLKELGVDCIWISPMYDSPQKDFGYDISNYQDLWPKFGTLQDMERLITEVHARGMKIILDLVINHTSDQHPWFKESRKNRDNSYAEWYHWQNPKYDKEGQRQPPNNWASFFGGSAWEYVPERDQYYLHLFTPEQPDLNWENEVVREALYENAIEFWLKKGINGFRVDTATIYAKDHSYADAAIEDPKEKFQVARQLFQNVPKMHDYWKDIGKIIGKYDDIFVIGETAIFDTAEILKYIAPKERKMSVLIDFAIFILGDRFSKKPHEMRRHTLLEMKTAIASNQAILNETDGWCSIATENHDQPRSVSRYATDNHQYRIKAAKMLALNLGTLSGSLFIYQGQEIGMVNVPDDFDPEYLRDPPALLYLQEIRERYPGDEEMMAKAMKGLQKMGRDNARTPVPWTSGPNAGFSAVKPWMPLIPDYKTGFNIEDERKDSNSVLSFWKKVLKLRKAHADLLIRGKFVLHDFENPYTFTYTKESFENGRDGKILVSSNFSDQEQPIRIPPELKGKKLDLLLGTEDELSEKLRPWEARAYLVT